MFSAGEVALAKARGFGLEVERYMWPMSDAERAAARAPVQEELEGVRHRVLHGTGLDRSVDVIHRLLDAQIATLFRHSLEDAAAHGIRRIVFHGDCFPDREKEDAWVARRISFWRDFAQEIPKDMEICIENFVGESPAGMAKLIDGIGESRFGICLDTGHAHCNSATPVVEWVRVLGARIRHIHLHSNDGASDQHLPPGQGTLDLKRVIQALEKKIRPTYTLECDAFAALAWLEDNALTPRAKTEAS